MLSNTVFSIYFPLVSSYKFSITVVLADDYYGSWVECSLSHRAKSVNTIKFERIYFIFVTGLRKTRVLSENSRTLLQVLRRRFLALRKLRGYFPSVGTVVLEIVLFIVTFFIF